MGGACSFGAAACSVAGLALFAAVAELVLDFDEPHPYEATRAIIQNNGESAARRIYFYPPRNFGASLENISSGSCME
jgi:hypothetical protein